MTVSPQTPAARSPLRAHESLPDRKEIFNAARNRWLGRVARDSKLPGGAFRVAILLWDKFNAKTGGAWPSHAYMAKALKVHRSTVIRAINALEEHAWLTHDPGHSRRSNFYRPCFAKLEDDDEVESTVAGLPRP